ncbi:aurora kinase A- and ninein-interacting protein [Guaruba guarouba]
MERGGGVPAPCDAWLDTAELKRSAGQEQLKRLTKAGIAPQRWGRGRTGLNSARSPGAFHTRPLGANPNAPLRVLARKCSSAASALSGGARPRTKQTTISSFFSRTDETDKENSRLPPFSPHKDWKGKGASVAASAVKILALPQMEGAQHQPPFRGEEGTALVTAQCCADPFTDPRVETSSGAGEGRCCFSLARGSEDARLIPRTHKAQLLAGEAASSRSSGGHRPEGREPPEEAKAGLDFQWRLGAKHSKKPQQGSSVNASSDFTENINPAVTSSSTEAPGFHPSPQGPSRTWPLRERSQNTGAASAEAGWDSPCRELFTQDSEGNRVIAHREVPSPCRQLPRSPSKGCSSSAAGWSWSELREQEPELCYELLFTQDSEGGRVIKH